MMKTTKRTLAQIKKGMVCTIKNIPAVDIRAQTIRFGLVEGKQILCQAVIPAGPIVVKVNRQEIALGRHLAEMIEVEEAQA